MLIHGIFESEDAAQLALVRLREAGLALQSVIIRYNEAGREQISDIAAVNPLEQPYATNGIAPAFIGGVVPMSQMLSGYNGMSYGILGYDMRISCPVVDAENREVLLEIQVPPQDVKRAEGVLINARGRQIHAQ